MKVTCKNCRREIPANSKICPYCSIKINQSKIKKTNQRKKIILYFVIVIIVLVSIFSIISIVDCYFGNRCFSSSRSTPIIDISAYPQTTGDTNNSCNIIIVTSPDTCYWGDISWCLVDITEGVFLCSSDESPCDSVIVTLPGLKNDTIENGQIITIEGCGYDLVKNYEYRFTLIYDPSGGNMATVTWTQ